MNDFNDTTDLHLLPVGSPAAAPILAQVTHIYTDLDGTLLAPGGRLLTNHAGKPSSVLAQALASLKVAGIDVILVTGRNRIQATEILRLLDLKSFIGEMGTVLQLGYGAEAEISYALGQWSNVVLQEGFAPGEIPEGLTPYQIISACGVVERLMAAFPGKLERHWPYGDNREVTQMLRGQIDLDVATALLAEETLPLELLDNGIIHPKCHNLTDVEQVHAYHLVPQGTSKAKAVAADITRRGLSADRTLAIGDAVGDVLMGGHTGSLVVVQNALGNNTVLSAIGELKVASALALNNIGASGDSENGSTRSELSHPVFCTAGHTADGWVEFARALLLAKGLG